ncbi:MAG: hypothetical protein P1U36_07390 [Legionellaceae bacterium]|nr:hypothetical protein [Legionellaceae bacterium]
MLRCLSTYTKFDFHPNYRLLTKLPGVFSTDQIKAQQRFSAASPHFARMHGGAMMHAFLDAVPEDYVERTRALGMLNKVDCRIHYLDPGDYPAQPGWHCDGSYQTSKISHANSYIVCSFSDNISGVSHTQFVKNKFTLCANKKMMNDAELWDKLNTAVENERPEVYTNHDGQMIEFDSATPHRAQQATQPGWRMFVRMSMWPNIDLDHEGVLTDTNKVYRASSSD